MRFFGNIDSRISLLILSSILYSAIVLLGLVNIQVVRGEYYTVLAERQHWVSKEVKPNRGRILSSDGYALATNEPAYLLYVSPSEITDPKETAQSLVDVLGWDIVLKAHEFVFEGDEDAENYSEEQKRLIVFDALEERLSLDLQWVALFHKISNKHRQELERLGLSGLNFEEEPARLYPEGTLAAHVLGFIGSDYRGGDQGYFGVEGFYDGDLRGDSGLVSEERTALGEPILVGGYERVTPVDGRDLVLTIDRTVQHIVETNLKKGVEHFDAASGTVVVLDPETGAVLALANYPTFDPNDPFKEEEENSSSEDQEEGEKSRRKNLSKRNLAIAATYEPGSVIKPLTIGAAMDLEVVTPQTTVNDFGKISASGFTVDNWDGKHHGTISIVDILVLSNNVGSAQVGQMVGASRLYDYFREFGIGKLTGVDMEGEDSGILKEPASWREIDVMTAAFGQGFSVTPLQLASAFGVFANGGKLMRPYVVSKVYEGDKVTEYAPEQLSRVLSEDTATTVREMLVKAVEGGEAKFYNIKNYTIAGKTGTAQIAEGGRYIATKTNATFLGFLPKDPRFVMLVKLEKPTASVYAAETAVPLWMDITKELVVYYGIVPDKQ